MITTQNLQQAKNQLKKEPSPRIVKAQSLEFNRKMLEYGKFDILLDIHESKNRDKLKQLDSGFNHVLAKIAAKNKISIGIDLDKIRNLNSKEKAKTLARIKQNIKICRKAKCNLALLKQKDPKDSFELMLSLGASTSQAKQAESLIN